MALHLACLTPAVAIVVPSSYPTNSNAQAVSVWLVGGKGEGALHYGRNFVVVCYVLLTCVSGRLRSHHQVGFALIIVKMSFVDGLCLSKTSLSLCC